MPELPAHAGGTIAIIGGGPAGSATALSLMASLGGRAADRASSREVAIFDAERPGGARIGETIPPAAAPALRRMGIEHVVEEGSGHLVCPGSISHWNSDMPGHNDFMLDVVGRGYHLDRTRFEEQLSSEARKAGVDSKQGWRLAGVRELPHCMELEFSVQGGAKRTVEADFVVDASGKAAALARRLRVARNVFDDVVFLCGLLDLPQGADMLTHTLVEAVPEGWWYAARLPKDKVIVTFCTDAEGMKANRWHGSGEWLTLLRQTKWVGKNIPASLLQQPAPGVEIIVRAAPSAILSAVCGQRWLAVGDAASSYDPITSAGITKALMHGELAGQAIAELMREGRRDALEAYQARVFDDFNAYVGVRNRLYRSETRFADSAFWARRLGKRPATRLEVSHS